MTAEPERSTSVARDSSAESAELEHLLAYIKECRGFDFSGYKRASLSRRIRRRMQDVGVESFRSYVDRLAVDPAEFGALFNTILINVTAFFRDPAAWEHLASHALPGLLAARARGEPIRIWSVGCASGEEAYTLAIVFAELLGEDEFRARVKIYAADVDDDALALARAGSYSTKDVTAIPTPLVEKYFERSDGRLVFRRDLRRSLIFGRHDLVQDPPISRIDLLVCRNVLMYFNADLQKRILSRFHFALTEGGLLFLGRAETLLTHSAAFVPVELKQRIFASISRMPIRERLLTLSPSEGTDAHQVADHREQLRSLAFDTGPVARIVTDDRGEVALISERARSLFGLLPSDLGRPLQDLEVSYRPVELRSCIDQAFTERRAIHLREIEWPMPGGGAGEGARWFDVIIEPLFAASRKPVGASVSFFDVSRSHELHAALEQANGELEGAYEELQSTNEELETTNEELQSTIEELETTNEELQSTNEELETMNEELQSTNEELQTMNSELGERSAAHDRANAVLESIVETLGAGLVVVDREFRVAVWNSRAADQWGMRADEAVGEHFLNLDIGLPVGELRGPLRAVLTGEGDLPDIVLNATNRRGRAILIRVSCRALRTSGDGTRPIEGVVMVMEEIAS